MKNSLDSLNQQFQQLTKKVPMQLLVFGQTLLIVGLIVLVPLIAIQIKNSKNNDSKASTASGTATISLSPATTQFAPNTQQKIDILVNTGTEKVDGVQAVIQFGNNVPSDLTFAPATVTGLTNIVNNLEAASGGQKASIAFITSNPQQPYTTNSALVKLGTFSFTVPASGTMSVAFNKQLTTAIKNGTSTDILQTPTDATYTFAFASNEPSLSFDTLTPPNPQVVGSNFQVNIVANTGDQKVSGVDAQITFDPTTVEIVSIQQGSGTPFPSYPELIYDNSTGKIFVSANIGTSANPTPVTGASIQVAKITGRTKKATSSTTLQYVFNQNDRNDSNLSLYIEQQGQEPADILAKVTNQELIAVNPATPTNTPTKTPGPTNTPGPTATRTPTPTPTPSSTPTPSNTPTPTLTPAVAVNASIQFALQGKNRTEANKTASLSFEAKSVDNTQNVTSTINTDSTGKATVALVPNNYVILVKTPGYLGKKIGSTSNPVQITSGSTPINLTSTPLLGGDLNGDNVINEVDYTLKFLTNLRGTDPVVDLDGSGTVNNLDFAIMRSNWALQSDTLQ